MCNTERPNLNLLLQTAPQDESVALNARFGVPVPAVSPTLDAAGGDLRDGGAVEEPDRVPDPERRQGRAATTRLSQSAFRTLRAAQRGHQPLRAWEAIQ